MTWCIDTEAIINRREKLGISQAEVARRLAQSGHSKGATSSLVSQWERGETTPKATTFYALAEILKINPRKLIVKREPAAAA